MEQSSDEKELSPGQRDSLLKEMKKRLEEIEALKRALNVKVEEEMAEEKTNQNPIWKVQEAIEEIVVPPLEMLSDKPLEKKPKKVAENP